MAASFGYRRDSSNPPPNTSQPKTPDKPKNNVYSSVGKFVGRTLSNAGSTLNKMAEINRNMPNINDSLFGSGAIQRAVRAAALGGKTAAWGANTAAEAAANLGQAQGLGNPFFNANAMARTANALSNFGQGYNEVTRYKQQRDYQGFLRQEQDNLTRYKQEQDYQRRLKSAQNSQYALPFDQLLAKMLNSPPAPAALPPAAVDTSGGGGGYWDNWGSGWGGGGGGGGGYTEQKNSYYNDLMMWSINKPSGA